MDNKKDLSVYMDAITARFRPVNNDTDATHWFSTGEVTDAINELDPGCHAKPEDVFQALLDAGFTFRSKPGQMGLNFRWLMVEK